MKALALWLPGLFFILFLYAEGDFPERGNPDAPASAYVSPTYIQRSIADTKTPNVVTAVLADYRGYDTLGETLVILTAGLAIVLILPRGKFRKFR